MGLVSMSFSTHQLSLPPVNHDNMGDSDTQMRDQNMKEESSEEETLVQKYQRLRKRGYDNESHQNTDTPSTPIKQESNDNDDSAGMINPQDRMNEDDDDGTPRRHSHARSSRASSTHAKPNSKPKSIQKGTSQPIFNHGKAKERINDVICRKMYDGTEIKTFTMKQVADFVNTTVQGSKISLGSCRDKWMRNRVMHAALQGWDVPCEWLERCVSDDVPLPEDDNAKACARKVKEGVIDGASKTIPAATVKGCLDWLDQCARAIGGGSDVKRRGRRAAQDTPTDGRGRRVKGKGRKAVQKGKNYAQDEDEDDEEELPIKNKEESGDDEEEPVVKDESDRDQEIVVLKEKVERLVRMALEILEQLNKL